MKSKTLQLEIPEYLTIEQYSKLSSIKGKSDLDTLIKKVAYLTGEKESYVSKWSLSSITGVFDKFMDVINAKNEFHSLIEWNGKLYGYASMTKATLGEYADIELFSQDLEKNLHKLAAIIYRPVEQHRFKSFKYKLKQSVKIVSNEIENVFDWYRVEPYDGAKREMVEEEFKDFPAHILLGALGFFLSTASLYLTNTAFFSQKITKNKRMEVEKSILENLSQNITAGGGLFTTSVKPIYSQYQGRKALSI